MDMVVASSRTAGHRWRGVARPEWLIDAWLELMPVRQAQTLSILHRAVLAASPSLMPAVKWGNVLYVRDGRPVAQLTPHRLAVHLQLAQPRGPRPRGSGPVAGLRFRLGHPIDSAEITYLVVSVLRYTAR